MTKRYVFEKLGQHQSCDEHCHIDTVINGITDALETAVDDLDCCYMVRIQVIDGTGMLMHDLYHFYQESQYIDALDKLEHFPCNYKYYKGTISRITDEVIREIVERDMDGKFTIHDEFIVVNNCELLCHQMARDTITRDVVLYTHTA